MASIRLDQHGEADSNDCREAEVSVQPPSDSYDATDTFGEPENLPRVGDEFQVELPQLIGVSDSLSPPRKATDVENRADADKKFLVGLPITLTRISSEERDTPGSCSSSKTNSGFTHSNSTTINKMEVSFGELEPSPSHSHDSRKSMEKWQNLPTSCKRSGLGYRLVPGFDEENWSAAEKDSFLLGLYIFEKDFVEVRRFVGTKEMGALLLYYYGKFYCSPEYRRWSECRKMKKKKGNFGRRIFSGPRQQQLVSRILLRVSEECRSALLEVSKTFGDGKMSLADYVFALKDMVGTDILVEAIGISKLGKQDLTRMALEPSRSNQAIHMQLEMPTGKSFSSLSTAEIIKFLDGDYRLSKARSNNLFWEAVWPRLLARGWHSEQPKNQGHLVFLMPSIKKFSRRELVKGDQCFDSVTDVLSRVAREPGLIELGAEVDEQNADELPTSQRHFYLQPRIRSRSSVVMKFTVVDTSLSDGKVRELRTLFSETSTQFVSPDHSDEDTHIDESDATNITVDALDTDGQKDSNVSGRTVNPDKDLQENTQSTSVSESLLEQENVDHTAPITKRSRIMIDCSQEAGLLSSSLSPRTESGSNGCSDAREVSERLLSQVSTRLDKLPSTSSTRGSPRESIENPRPRTLIDLNLPLPDNEDGVFATESNKEQDIITSHHSEDHRIPSSDVQSNLNPRRQSTRIRPLTSRAIEAVAHGYLTKNQRRKRKEASSDDGQSS